MPTHFKLVRKVDQRLSRQGYGDAGMKRSDAILQITVEQHQHRLLVSDLLATSAKRYLVAARRDAMIAMKAEGLSVARIASALNRSRTVVREHLNPARKAYRKIYRAQKWIEKTRVGA